MDNTYKISDTNKVHFPTVQFLDIAKVRFFMSPIDGRGVVANQDIDQNEIIERCPLIPLLNRSRYQLEPNIWRYCFPKPLCDCADCKNHGFLFFMMAGHGMIYNHQDDNNANVILNFNDLYADIVANKTIKKDEEVFVNYGPEYFNHLTKKSITDVI